MGKGEGEEFGGRQGRDPGKEPGLAVGRAGPALSVFSETDSGAACPWVLPWDPGSLQGPAWRRVAAAGISGHLVTEEP